MLTPTATYAVKTNTTPGFETYHFYSMVYVQRTLAYKDMCCGRGYQLQFVNTASIVPIIFSAQGYYCATVIIAIP